ncbi:MAG: SMC-Scp complex subunit ScpB [Bacteriovoracaceae bacterium]
MDEKKDFELELDYFNDKAQEEKLWMARTGLDYNSLCGAIETLIFMSDKPLSLKKIKNMIDPDMSIRVIHESISRLQSEYEEKHHGIRLVEVADGFQFRTKATYSKYVKDLFKVTSLVLTPSSLEVLAIIAYKQPVSKTEIEKIRGVDSSHLVRALMDKRLVKTSGRSQELGRPTVYITTPEFLEVFNLASLEELPPESEIESIAKTKDVGEITDIKSLVTNGQKRFYFDEYEELDKLSEEIKQINVETNFTKSLRKNKPEENDKQKSAFDILEDFIVEKQLKEQMQLAAQSSLPNPAMTDGTVIRDLLAKVYNAPEMESDFEMIDLDSGMPVSDLENEEELVELGQKEEQLLEKASDLLDRAKDFDIDLDFLQDKQ